MPTQSKADPCQWIDLTSALASFAGFKGKTESQQHIKPLHWYVACRLVIEGGFMPDDITPRPPFLVHKVKRERILEYDAGVARGSERTVLGGLKTKNVDVVVTKEGIGPVVAVSCKGATKAYRNLTNRLEEAAGDCVNLHITYPALVYGYLFVARANREKEGQYKPNDVGIRKDEKTAEGLIRFEAALRELVPRRAIRNEVSRYEAAALALIETGEGSTKGGSVVAQFPASKSSLRIEKFFGKIYQTYYERFVLGAPNLRKITNRVLWSEHSPIFDETVCKDKGFPALDYEPRVSLSLEETELEEDRPDEDAGPDEPS